MATLPPRQLAPSVGLSFERRLLVDAGLLLLPMLSLSGLLVWLLWPLSTALWLALATAVLLTIALTLRMRQRVIYPLYTLSNLLEALREGDYSLRGSRARRGDAIGDVVWEINALSRTLREQRLKVEETSALLGKVIAAIDIALFSFDDGRCLRLLNPAAERLIGKRASAALGEHATALGLEEALESTGASVLDRTFAGGSGRFEVRRFSFREGGLPLELLAITDLSRALREEERQAWQRLIRVLSHELNNSLAPIKSMAGTLSAMLNVDPPPTDWREDAQLGMRVIADRADALSRFMIGYATLARLPPPRKQRFELRALLQRVCTLEQRTAVRLPDGPPLWVLADPDQIEQALINLLKNAVEASLPESAAVTMQADQVAAEVRVEIVDSGLGLAGSDNLFVPFFTTKPGGSGIGLVLARQIVEAHGGSLRLANRADRQGCVASMSLPAQAT